MCIRDRPGGLLIYGIPNFKLENLTKVNQINHGTAHTALSDATACFEIAKKIKTGAPDIWDSIIGSPDEDTC